MTITSEWRSNRPDPGSLHIGDEELIVTQHSYDGVEDALQLYDLASDPAQQNDLFDERPARVAQRREVLERLEDGYAEAPLPASEYSLTPAARRALEALGYF